MSSPPGLNPVGGSPIVCVGFNDWDNEVWTNQHHLMYRLAAGGSRVLFIESLGLRRPSLGSGRDLRRIIRRLRRGLQRPRLRDGVFVLSPLVLPVHSSVPVRRLNAALLKRQVRAAVSAPSPERPVLWGYVPAGRSAAWSAGSGAGRLPLRRRHRRSGPGRCDSFAAAEQRFARRADLVLACAPALAERMRRFSDMCCSLPTLPTPTCLPTALDAGPVDSALAALPEPRIVFIGAIVPRKLDLELVAGWHAIAATGLSRWSAR